MTTQKKESHYNKTYKLIAQTIGLAVCLLGIFYIAGVVAPQVAMGRSDGSTTKLALMLIPIAGFIQTWYMEKIGALIIVASSIILLVYYIIQPDYTVSLMYGLPFIMTGALFLLHLKKRNELKAKK